jgi:hypothetical protein
MGGITDQDGKYAVSLPDGAYDFSVYADGYQQCEGNFNINGGALSVPTVVLSKIYNVRFIVTDGYSPVNEAAISVGGVSAATGFDGAATLPLAAGVYTYTVQRAGLNTGGGTINVAGDMDQYVTLTGGVNVVFSAVNDYGEPVAGAVIEVDGVSAITGSDGTAAMWMAPGSHYYVASHSGYNGIAAALQCRRRGRLP